MKDKTLEDPGLPPRIRRAMEQHAKPYESYEALPAPIGFNGRLQVFRDGAGNAVVLFEGTDICDYIARKVLKEGCYGREVLCDMEFIL